MGNDVFVTLTERLKAPNSEYLLRILHKTITAEEGELLLELPAPTAELAKKFRRSEDDIKGVIQSLLKRGMLVGGPHGLTLPLDRLMLHHVYGSTLPELNDPEVNQIWKEWYEVEFAQLASTYFKGPEGPGGRIVPTSKSLDDLTKLSQIDILPYEDPRKIIQRVTSIALVDCACRRTMVTCNHPVDVCLHFDDRAEFALSRPSGRKLSVDEALAVLARSEAAGLLNSVENWTFPFNEMCFCCSEGCVVINSAMRYGTLSKELAKSRFQAEIDEDACTGCGLCARRCQFGAITMEKIPGEKKKQKARIYIEKCWGCGQCTQKCKPEAILLKLVRPATYIPEGKVQTGPRWIL